MDVQLTSVSWRVPPRFQAKIAAGQEKLVWPSILHPWSLMNCSVWYQAFLSLSFNRASHVFLFPSLPRGFLVRNGQNWSFVRVMSNLYTHTIHFHLPIFQYKLSSTTFIGLEPKASFKISYQKILHITSLPASYYNFSTRVTSHRDKLVPRYQKEKSGRNEWVVSQITHRPSNMKKISSLTVSS